MDGSRPVLAGLGIGAFAVLCCAAAPLLLGVAGGIAVGTALGVGAGVLAAIAATVLGLGKRRSASASLSKSKKTGEVSR